MDVRQSHLKSWAACPLRFRYENIDHLPREQSASLTFGTIMHLCVQMMEETGNPEEAKAFFRVAWAQPENVDPGLKIDYYVRGTNWKSYDSKGPRIIDNWWSIYQWESDVILAREYQFRVPIGQDGNHLTGTMDRLVLRFMPKIDKQVVLVTDYKTTKKQPTVDGLAEDLQFSAYGYATTVPQFWDGLPGGSNLYTSLLSAPRWGEWIHLVDVRRMDAGERTQRHYNRLAIAVDALARSVEAGIFVPTITGETCRYCDFRANCGLPDRAE